MEQRRAFKCKEWKISGNAIPDKRNSQRMLRNMIIGEYTNATGSREYITEILYEDIIKGIMTKVYSYDCDIHSVPPITVFYQDTLIHHNPYIEGIISEITEAAGKIPTELLLQAMSELRNNRHGTDKLGATTKSVRNLFYSITGNLYSNRFLGVLLRDLFKASFVNKKDELGRELSITSVGELHSLLTDSHIWIIDTNSSSTKFQSLVETYTFQHVVKSIEKEIADRFFFGDLT